jgi:hypothetical protein
MLSTFGLTVLSIFESIFDNIDSGVFYRCVAYSQDVSEKVG